MPARWRAATALLVLLLAAAAVWLLARAGWEVPALLSQLERADLRLFWPAMALLPLVGFPIAPFYLFAGLAFPFGQAVLVCWSALAISISLSYAIAQGLFAAPLRGWLERRGYALPVLSATNQFRVTFLMRTIPGPPFAVQNYLLSLGGIRFGTYFWTSWLTQGVLATGVIWLSDRVGGSGRGAEWMIALALVALLGIFKLFRWIRRVPAPVVSAEEPVPVETFRR